MSKEIIDLLEKIIKVQIPADKPFNIQAYMDLCSKRQHIVDQAIDLLKQPPAGEFTKNLRNYINDVRRPKQSPLIDNLCNYGLVACDIIDSAEASKADLLNACEEARLLYDHLALGTLEAACKYGDTYEHMDCMLHEIPFYIQTLKFPQLTIDTLYNCSMIRQGLMTRDEALKNDEEKLSAREIPGGLKYFLKEIKMSYDDFIGYTKEVGKAQQFYSKKKQAVASTS